MGTTRVVTREYDAEGRLVREVETTYEWSNPPAYQPAPQWWQQPITSWQSTTTLPNTVTVN